jgi:hypothetical protein
MMMVMRWTVKITRTKFFVVRVFFFFKACGKMFLKVMHNMLLWLQKCQLGIFVMLIWRQ